MNLLYGFISGALTVALVAIWQYRKYVQSIRAVSDKWKGINDEWAARYHNLYYAWLSGVKPTFEECSHLETTQIMREMNDLEKGYEPLIYNGRRVIPTSSKSDPSV